MNIKKSVLSLALIAATSMSFGQELPKTSPPCVIQQSIGLTNIKLEYSRPSAVDREIFGGLLPYGEVWRLGANASTKITTDQPLKFGDQLLPAGTYAMFAIPNEKEWTVAFNSVVEQWGTRDYDESKNVVSLKVIPSSSEHSESLNIYIDQLVGDESALVIEWSDVKVWMPFKLNTKEVAEKNIDAAIEKGENLDQVYYNASRYFTSEKDTEKAAKYIDLSIAEKEGFKNLFHKAKLEADKGDKKQAVKLAEKAVTMAKDENENGWADYIQESIDDWKK